MELLTKNKSLSLLAAGLLFSGSAMAILPATGTKPLNSIIGVTSSTLNVTIKDGTAYVSGTVDSGGEISLVLSHVSNMDGVDRVVNMVTVH